MKKIISMMCIIAMALSLFVPIQANAQSQGPCWTKNGSEWTYEDGQGTSLVAKVIDKTLYIKGNGAIPSYSRDCLGNRPWHNMAISSLVIEDGITSIGAEAFSNMKNMTNVSMPVSAFIEDVSAFAGAHEECIFNIRGMNFTSRNVGKIPYTSLDSIVAMMKCYDNNYRYQLANYYVIGMARNSGKVNNLFPFDATGKDYNPAYPLIDYSSTLKVKDGKGLSFGSITIENRQQGLAALEAFSLVIGDQNYVAAYNVAVNGTKGIIKNTSAPVQYTMTIPNAFRFPGRQFSLIQLGNGVINILQDEDTSDDTITFTTDYPSTVYALIYTDTSIQGQ